jgi:hypothetical protein
MLAEVPMAGLSAGRHRIGWPHRRDEQFHRFCETHFAETANRTRFSGADSF